MRPTGFPPDSKTAFSYPKTRTSLEEMQSYVASPATDIKRETTSPYKSSCTAHSSKPRLGPENSYLPHPALREHSHPQTPLSKSKSANTWRSLVSLLCSGETKVSQGTDIIPDSMVQTSQRRDAQDLLLIRMSLPVYLFD